MTYHNKDFGAVNMRNKDTSQVAGIGDEYVETETGWSSVLKGVRHVPNFRLNLVLALNLDDADCNVNLLVES